MASNNDAMWRPRLPLALRRKVKQKAKENGQKLDFKTAEIIRKGLAAEEAGNQKSATA